MARSRTKVGIDGCPEGWAANPRPRLRSLRSSLTPLPPRVAPTSSAWVGGVRPTSSTKQGYGYRWQQARAAFLREHPLCQCPDCDDGRRRVVPSDVVDHIQPHRGDPALFWDQSNWQAMAKRCHDRKTGRGE